jgi:HSP20 family molecular chaperone IbpA
MVVTAGRRPLLDMRPASPFVNCRRPETSGQPEPQDLRCARLPDHLMPRSIRIARVLAMADRVAADLQRLHFRGVVQPTEVWQPAVNIYAHAAGLEVCVDLAGVEREAITVHADPRRLIIRGRRELPDCGHPTDGCGRLLVMEIPDGDFERLLEFTIEVDPSQVEARQDNGWLWISLPYACKEDRR